MFQGVNRRFVLLFESEEDRKVSTGYCLPKVEIKKYSVMIDAKNFFDHSVKSSISIYVNTRKIETGQRDDFTTGCLLDYNYFKEYYKRIAIHLCKQQALDVDPKAIQQINFTGNLDRAAVTAKFFVIE